MKCGKMAIRLVYLTTLKLLDKGEMFLYSDDKWVLPSYSDATIIGQALQKLGCLQEENYFYKTEINEIKYYKLSKEGLIQLERGKKWWGNLSLLEKIFIRFKFW